MVDQFQFQFQFQATVTLVDPGTKPVDPAEILGAEPEELAASVLKATGGSSASPAPAADD